MRTLRILFILLALGLPAFGQQVNVTANKIKLETPSGACTAGSVRVTTAGVIYSCQSGTWATAGGGSSFTSAVTITSAANPCFAVGPNGATNPVLSANCSVASQATGILVTGRASGAGVTLAVQGGGSNENLQLFPKGTGLIQLWGTSSSHPAIRRNASLSTLILRNGDDTLNAAWIAGTFLTYNDALSVSGFSAVNGTGPSVASTLQYVYSSTIDSTGSKDLGTGRFAAGVLRVTNASTGAGQLLIGTSTDTADAQLSVYSQSTTRPSLKLRALSGTASTQNVLESYNAAGTLAINLTSGGAGTFGGAMTATTYTATGTIIGFSSSTTLRNSSDGVLLLTDAAATSFNRLQFGGTTSSFPALKRSSAILQVRLADDSAFAQVDASIFLANSGGAGSALSGSGVGITRDASITWTNSNSTPLSGTQASLFASAAATQLIGWGGTTSSFPGLKRSSAELQFRLADDSAFAASMASINNLDKTITAGGTTGDQTINKSSFTVNFAAAATTITVTNSFVTANSNIICTAQTNDTTLKSVAAAPGSGSVVLTANAAATAETRVGCVIHN